jgi:hypothetical protein
MSVPQAASKSIIHSHLNKFRCQLAAWLQPIHDYPEQLAEKRQDAMIGHLRTVLAVANELISCPTMDTTLRQAVEAIRTALAVERCAIYIAHDGFLHGTYGTDLHRCTTDEHANSFPISEIWQ